jgi:membrane-associated phospholipid phosphatase
LAKGVNAKLMAVDQKYLEWQKRLSEDKMFRRFWKFWGIYSVLLVFGVGGCLLLLGRWREVLAAFAAFVLVRAIVSPLIYVFYKRQRPYQKLNFIPAHSILLSEPTTRHSSFPSDHAISLAAITTVLFWFFPILGIVLIVTTLLNGWARVILGYHYATDILAGWVLGSLGAILTIYWLTPLLFTR